MQTPRSGIFLLVSIYLTVTGVCVLQAGCGGKWGLGSLKRNELLGKYTNIDFSMTYRVAVSMSGEQVAKLFSVEIKDT